MYPNISSSIAPVPHSAHLPAPTPPPFHLEREHTFEEGLRTINNEECTLDDEYQITADEFEEENLFFSKQKDMNDFIMETLDSQNPMQNC